MKDQKLGDDGFYLQETAKSERYSTYFAIRTVIKECGFTVEKALKTYDVDEAEYKSLLEEFETSAKDE
jgi:hypothetical protein